MIAKTLRKITLCFALAGVATVAALPVLSFAQEAPAAGETAAGADGDAAKKSGPKTEETTLLDKYKMGGWVMHFLLLASFLTVWFGIDGFLKTTKKRAIPPAQVAQIRELFKQGDYVGAYNYAKLNPSPLSDVVRAGISFLPDGKNMTEEAMFNEINRLQGALMGRVSYLSVVGGCSPMIGLVGTVLGMMSAFGTLGESGVGDPSKLSAAIGHVLVATASGLFVAIPAFILYYVLRNRISVILHHVQTEAAALFRKMQYEAFEGYQLGDEEIYAALPNWVAPQETAAIESEQPSA